MTDIMTKTNTPIRLHQAYKSALRTNSMLRGKIKRMEKKLKQAEATIKEQNKTIEIKSACVELSLKTMHDYQDTFDDLTVKYYRYLRRHWWQFWRPKK